jgi:hypothetical protein
MLNSETWAGKKEEEEEEEEEEELQHFRSL